MSVIIQEEEKCIEHTTTVATPSLIDESIQEDQPQE